MVGLGLGLVQLLQEKHGIASQFPHVLLGVGGWSLVYEER